MCCNGITACQSLVEPPPTINFLDGGGEHAFTMVNPNLWEFTADGWATEGWIVRTGVALCADHHKRVSLFRSSGPPGYPIDFTLFVAQPGNPRDPLLWYENSTSPYSPRTIVQLTT
jgi:hypothetical protein